MKSFFGNRKPCQREPRAHETRVPASAGSQISSLLRRAAASGGSGFQVTDATLVERVNVVPAGRPSETVSHIQKSNYTIGNAVAHGGMGTIFHARDLNLRRTVAMKIILPEKDDAEQYRLRFLQEAQLTAQLEHPNIVPVHELSTNEQGKPFYTMKFVKGLTLNDVLGKIKEGDAEVMATFPLAHLLTIFQKVCDAVAFAHSRGVVHRDLKPENIMIGDYGEVLVMDWGLAKLVESRESRVESQMAKIVESRERRVESQIDSGSRPSTLDSRPDLTLAGQIVGTPNFMAPEQTEGKVDEIDARTDIFALGGILYNILTLHPPVLGRSVQEIIEKIRTGTIPHASTYSAVNLKRRKHAEVDRADGEVLSHYSCDAIPESMTAVAMKALACKKEDRYQTVQELQREIEAFQGGFATAAEQAGALRLLVLLIKRNRAGAAALLIVFIVASVFMLKIIVSERQARATLAELRGTASTFSDQALALIREHKFNDALHKVTYAIKLAPERADHHVLKGNILQSLLRVREARDSYAQALERDRGHLLAKKNLKLCETILHQNEGRSELLPQSLAELQVAMREQERFSEAVALMNRLQKNEQLVEETLKAALKKAGLTPDASHWGKDVNGFWISLAGVPVEHLDFLEGIPLSRLHLMYTRITDLDPLKGMPLTTLHLNETEISDLSPLQGMPITYLDLSGTLVSDISSLAGMPLTFLNLAATRVNDLSPLRGMPLKRLIFSSTAVTDLSPLKGMALDQLVLGNTAVIDLSPLRGMLLTALSLQAARITDLSPLKGMALKVADLRGTPITEISPLKGMPLEALYLGSTPITDVSVLNGMPLRQLALDGCKELRDLSPLASCSELEVLVLPVQCRDVEFLRPLPKLQRLGYEHPGNDWNAVQPAAEFWKAYDAKKAGAGK